MRKRIANFYDRVNRFLEALDQQSSVVSAPVDLGERIGLQARLQVLSARLRFFSLGF